MPYRSLTDAKPIPPRRRYERADRKAIIAKNEAEVREQREKERAWKLRRIAAGREQMIEEHKKRMRSRWPVRSWWNFRRMPT